MEYRTLGKTGLQVSRIGLGMFQIGKLPADSDPQVSRLLNTALDKGINFLDTATGYDYSEERIGRAVGHRRDEYVLATKCGLITGTEPWTTETINRHVDRSLKRLRTDYLDLIQLHSCDAEVLERGEVTEALLRARDAGKTRFVGYSGDNQAAQWAIDSGLFDALETSFNLVDQRARTTVFSRARQNGMGVIVKRTIANGAWGAKPGTSNPSSQFASNLERSQKMDALGPIPGAPADPVLLALGFTMAHDGFDVALIGTTNTEHLLSNLALFETKLPIPQLAVQELYRRFDTIGGDWEQLP